MINLVNLYIYCGSADKIIKLIYSVLSQMETATLYTSLKRERQEYIHCYHIAIML